MDASELGIDVRSILEDQLGLDGSVRGNEFWLCCPNPEHPDQHPSCSVNLISGLGCCFSCHLHTDLAGLVSLVRGVPYAQALTEVRPGSREALLSTLRHKMKRTPRKPRRALPGPYSEEPLDYLRGRGLSDETLERWGARFVLSERVGRLNIHACVALPLYNASHVLQGWIYRSTDKSPPMLPKYVHTPGLPVASVWFGEHLFAEADHILVVEGPVDAMWCSQAGLPALACMGSSLSERKIAFLKRYRRVVVLPDRDRAGARFVDAIVNGLGYRVPVGIARYPSRHDASDPCEVEPKVLRQMVERATPSAVLRLQPARLRFS